MLDLGKRKRNAPCVRGTLIEQALERVELRMATTAPHLPVGDAQDFRRDAERGLAVGALSEQRARLP